MNYASIDFYTIKTYMYHTDCLDEFTVIISKYLCQYFHHLINLLFMKIKRIRLEEDLLNVDMYIRCNWFQFFGALSLLTKQEFTFFDLELVMFELNKKIVFSKFCLVTMVNSLTILFLWKFFNNLEIHNISYAIFFYSE